MVAANSNSDKSALIILAKENAQADLIKIAQQKYAHITSKHSHSIQTQDKLSTALQSYLPSSLQSIHILIQSSELDDLFDPLSLAHLVPFMSPSGKLYMEVHLPEDKTSPNLQMIHTAFLLAGISAQSEQKDIHSNTRILTASHQSKSKSSSSAKIQIKPKPVKLRLNLADEDEDEDDLMDEDDLLTHNLVTPPPEIDVEQRQKDMDDCGGRKACDNCTCGRAQIEQDEASAAAGPPPTSACGNCGKGDAFRCAGCPHLGKPAFQEGEEHLVLDLTDDI